MLSASRPGPRCQSIRALCQPRPTHRNFPLEFDYLHVTRYGDTTTGGELSWIVAPRAAIAGRTVLVTAGGTREPIDPVRYIGNRSSGKQGYAIAREAHRRGAHVTHEQPVEMARTAVSALSAIETALSVTLSALSSW